MSDTENTNEDKQRLEKDNDKENNKLKYFLEETDEVIQIRDYIEMEIANKRAEKIIAKIIGSCFTNRGVEKSLQYVISFC